MLRGSVQIGRAAGIPINLHYSWFVIAALITFSLAGHFREVHSTWQPSLLWSVSVLTAILFFVTLLAHELSHALVARSRGLPVRSITLFALGGIASIEKGANTAKTEFLVAMVGPIVSVTIGVSCIAAAETLGWSYRDSGGGAAGSVLGWLGSINVLLAVFNLIPGYPLDGGRVLRALLWGIYDDQDRATLTAARVGQVVAALFIGLGLLRFIFGPAIDGLWLAFIGWFLFMAAQATRIEQSIAQSLGDVRVADVMANECPTVDPITTVQVLVDDVLVRTGRRCVIVKSNGQVLGLVTPREIRAVDRARWSDVAVRDIMRPVDTLLTVNPATPAAEALTSMLQRDLDQLLVVADSRLEGMISRGQILQVLQSRAELLRGFDRPLAKQ